MTLAELTPLFIYLNLPLRPSLSLSLLHTRTRACTLSKIDSAVQTSTQNNTILRLCPQAHFLSHSRQQIPCS